jgi:hypothetical protein
MTRRFCYHSVYVRRRLIGEKRFTVLGVGAAPRTVVDQPAMDFEPFRAMTHITSADTLSPREARSPLFCKSNRGLMVIFRFTTMGVAKRLHLHDFGQVGLGGDIVDRARGGALAKQRALLA